jgi:hypothetical protein
MIKQFLAVAALALGMAGAQAQGGPHRFEQDVRGPDRHGYSQHHGHGNRMHDRRDFRHDMRRDGCRGNERKVVKERTVIRDGRRFVERTVRCVSFR